MVVLRIAKREGEAGRAVCVASIVVWIAGADGGGVDDALVVVLGEGSGDDEGAQAETERRCVVGDGDVGITGEIAGAGEGDEGLLVGH